VKDLFEWVLSNIGKAISISTAIIGISTFLIGYGMQKANKANDLEKLKKDVQYTKEVVISSQAQQTNYIMKQTRFNDSMSTCMKTLQRKADATQDAVREIAGQSNLTNNQYRSILDLLYFNKESSELKKKELPFVTMQ
jgi:hypothetical protein